jgi:hypothetical protein
MAAQVNAPFGFQWCGMDSGMPAPALEEVEVTSGVDLAIGDPVRLSGGYGVLCTTSQTPYGVSTEDLTSAAAARTKILVIPITQGSKWRAQSTSTAACSQANVGSDYGMASTSGSMGLVLGTTTGPWNIIGIDPRSAAGTYTIFIVKANKSQYSGVS